MCDKLFRTLQELFDYYMNSKGHENSSSKPKRNQLYDLCQDDFDKYIEDRDQGGIWKSECDLYLVDAR